MVYCLKSMVCTLNSICHCWFFFYPNVSHSPFSKNPVPSTTTPTSNTMANPLAKTDVTSHLIIENGFTAQVAVDESGRTCHAIGPYDLTFCNFCWKEIKITSLGKHLDFQNKKRCPCMRNGSCDTTFKPGEAKGTCVYPTGARPLTNEEKERNQETMSSLKSHGRMFRNKIARSPTEHDSSSE